MSPLTSREDWQVYADQLLTQDDPRGYATNEALRSTAGNGPRWRDVVSQADLRFVRHERWGSENKLKDIEVCRADFQDAQLVAYPNPVRPQSDEDVLPATP